MSNVQDASRQQSDDAENDYNRIFETLVKDEDDDLTGLVAYSLYKRSKKEWAADLWVTKRRKPTDAELRSYVAFWTDSQLKSLQAQAQNALNAYASTFIDSATSTIREDAIKDEVRGLRIDIRRDVRSASGWVSWGWGIVGSLLAAAAYTAILIFAAWAIKRNGIDLISLLK